MHLMREDEYEPMTMRRSFGPIPENKLNRPRRYETPPKKGNRGRPKKWTLEDRKGMADDAEDMKQIDVAAKWGCSEVYVWRQVQARKRGEL